jgi:hypothetical protein
MPRVFRVVAGLRQAASVDPARPVLCLRPLTATGSRVKFRLVSVAAIAGACVALAGCGTMSKLWPFHKKAKTGPEAVEELSLVNADGTAATYPQYWKRNTLVIDLSGVGGQGAVAAKLREGAEWPVRVAVRVRPGSVQQIEIQAEERDILPVSTAGTQNIDLELAPSVYRPKTAAIYISWGAMAPIVEGPAEPATPEYVSPMQVPTPSAAPAIQTPPAEAIPKASDIIPPGSVTPPQSPGN